MSAMKHTPTDPPAPQLLLSRPEVERLTGLSTSSLYRAMRNNDFPEPLRITQRAVRWCVAADFVSLLGLSEFLCNRP